MFEKQNIIIHTWNEVLSYEKCSEELIRTLEGKPVIIYVAGVKQKIGTVRKARYGASGITVDLVLATDEVLSFNKKEDGTVIFKEIYMNYPDAVLKAPKIVFDMAGEQPLDCGASTAPDILRESEESKNIGGPDEEITEP